MLEEAYRLDHQMGDPSAVDVILLKFARALGFADLHEAAVQLLGAAEAIHETAGWKYPDWVLAIKEATTVRARAGLGEAAFAEVLERGRQLTPDEAEAIAVAALKDDAPAGAPSSPILR